MANRPRPAIRFIDDALPETLRGALFLLYVSAVIDVLTGALSSTGGTLVAVGNVAAALAMVQARRWGYSLAIGLAVARVVPYVLSWSYFQTIGASPLDLFFAVLLVALMLHPRSREHQRLYFH